MPADDPPRTAPLAAALPPRTKALGSSDFDGGFASPSTPPSVDALLDGFLGYVASIGLELYPAQEEALLELFAGKNVILNTPTGSGKSLVAAAVHFQALAQGERVFYTSPIKALVSEKFFDLCRELGADNVGMMTGDASVNRTAPIICCTAEILANIALGEGARADVQHVVMDEFHYYSDRDRGVAWQIPLLTLPQARFLLMSATLGDVDFFQRALTELTGRETAVVRSVTRPVPLDFSYAETPLHETIASLITRGRAPVYIVNFTQRACAETAQNLLSTDFCTKDDKRAIALALDGVKFPSPYGREINKLLRHGIGIHHAGLLPRYRLLVERLAQRGLLKIICGTDTLGVGVNIPIRTVLFTRLCKFDGEKVGILSVRDFQQISGRAGRKGFDVEGSIVAQAPEHVIENLRLEAKAGDDPSKRRKIVRKKPPERGYVHWDRGTFDKLVTSQPEPLRSRFAVSHGMLLQVLSRDDGCRAMKQLLIDCHESDGSKRALRRRAIVDLRALYDAGVVELEPRANGVGKRIVIAQDLQRDFSLNHALSLYLLDTVERFDRQSPTYALDVLTLCESIVEDPDVVLMRQVDALKTRKMAEMKAAGVEYDERIAELEKITYPKPNAETIYATFNEFAHKHPWVGAENIRPKSIAREMFEMFLSFDEYVKEYDLQRSEGTLLRYLTEVYKVVVQTVPPGARDDGFEEIATYLGDIVRGVDSSLLEEWQRIRRAADELATTVASADEQPPAQAPFDVTRDRRAFTIAVRNEVFRLVRSLATGALETTVEILAGDATPPNDAGSWTVERVTEAMRGFWEEHTRLRTDTAARAPTATRIVTSVGTWGIEQTLFDGDDDNDWLLRLTVDLERSRAAGRPVLALEEITR